MPKKKSPRGCVEVTSHLARSNIDKIAEFERAFLQQRSITDRIGDALGGFAGSLTFVVLHIFWFAGWILINLGMVPGIRPFDEFPFNLLQLLVSLEAVFLSTFVLIRQNRMSRQADQRTHLDLQINLLAERETTKMLQMLQSLCDRLGLKEEAQDKETAQLSEEIHLETLAHEIKENLPGD